MTENTNAITPRMPLTKANASLVEWWQALNDELARQGLTAVPFGPARDHYETGRSPEAAAASLVAEGVAIPQLRAGFFTEEEWRQLLENGTAAQNDTLDPVPVAKLFTPDAGATWLLTEIDPDEPDMAFGLCDLGLGCPEIGFVSLTEIRAVRGSLNLPVEKDLCFKPRKRLSELLADAQRAGRIIT